MPNKTKTKKKEPRVHRSLRKSTNSITDQEAQLIFRRLLPTASWEVYNISPDIGKDQQLELIEKGEYSGITLVIQLKGQRRIAKSKRAQTISFKLKTHYLEYFDKIRLPVFLIVVDVTKQQAYWLFVQKYIREILNKTHWRSSSSRTLAIPVASTFDDLSVFRQGVLAADNYMANLHPGSVASSIAAEASRLEALDPRFKVELTATERTKHYTLIPKADIDVRFRLKGTSIESKIGELIERGLPVRFSEEEIEAEGSALVAETLKGEVTLRAGLSANGILAIRRRYVDGNSAIVFTLPTTIEGGRSEVRIHARGEVVRMDIVATRDRPVRIKVNIDLTRWANQDVLVLPMFEEILDWSKAVLSGSEIVVESMVGILPPIVLPFSASEFRDPEGDVVLEYVEFTDRVRSIARAFGQTLHLPETITERDLIAADKLFRLAEAGEYSQPATAFRFAVDLPAGDLKQIVAEGGDERTCRPITLTQKHVDIELFGTPIPIGPVALTLTNGIIETIQELDGSDVKLINVQIVGTPNSRMTIRRKVAERPADNKDE